MTVFNFNVLHFSSTIKHNNMIVLFDLEEEKFFYYGSNLNDVGYKVNYSGWYHHTQILALYNFVRTMFPVIDMVELYNLDIDDKVYNRLSYHFIKKMMTDSKRFWSSYDIHIDIYFYFGMLAPIVKG